MSRAPSCSAGCPRYQHSTKHIMKNSLMPVWKSLLASTLWALALLGVVREAPALVPEPGNIYYGLARDMFGQPLLPGSGAQVIMVRTATTNEYTLAVSEILTIPASGPAMNYILRPSLDDGQGARYANEAGRSNEVTQVYVVINGFRYAVTNNAGCPVFNDAVPRLGGRGAIAPVNVRANDDFNGNCLSDAWECIHFDCNSPADPNDDPDSDGFTNLQEFLALTDPWNPASTPQIWIQIVSKTGSRLTLDWNRSAGQRYTLEWATNVVGTYTAVPANRLSGANTNVVDLNGLGKAFIRVRRE